jgi:NAD(P)-dependent dehydrogenase (short-subunit alcohol dehydrogenase family)
VPLDVLRDRVLFETDVADTVLFLASDKSKFITAHKIAPDARVTEF